MLKLPPTSHLALGLSFSFFPLVKASHKATFWIGVNKCWAFFFSQSGFRRILTILCRGITTLSNGTFDALARERKKEENKVLRGEKTN